MAYLRNVETDLANYHGSASGFLAEIDRMQLVEYLSLHPAELANARVIVAFDGVRLRVHVVHNSRDVLSIQ